jgi:hypothetical protein
MDNLYAPGDNNAPMTRQVPKKNETIREITDLLGIPAVETTVGSSIPAVFFSSVAKELGLPPLVGMPAIARQIIEFSHLPWSDEFSSELAPSGGGGTVTALGLIQVKNAVLVWLGHNVEAFPTGVFFEVWNPREDWADQRNVLPKELREFTDRPGASQFREKILSNYENRCAVSGFISTQTIDIAHIVPYYGVESDHDQNALPLRADLHRLFDQGMLKIKYEVSQKKYRVYIHDFVLHNYEEFNGVELITPDDPSLAPSRQALEVKLEIHKKHWQEI